MNFLDKWSGDLCVYQIVVSFKLTILVHTTIHLNILFKYIIEKCFYVLQY